MREGGDVKAFGAGVLSSFGELQHMAAGRAELVPLDVSAPLPKMSYKCVEYPIVSRCCGTMQATERQAALAAKPPLLLSRPAAAVLGICCEAAPDQRS